MDNLTPIEQLNALKRIQETLKINRNDIGTLLELAALQEKAELKRKVLNRILTLDPINKQAREMLVEMDRAAMGEGHSQTASSNQVANDKPKETFVFRYSIIHQILVYPIVAFSILFTLRALGSWEAFLFFAACSLLISIPVWFVSAVVEVSHSGIKLSRLFGIYRREMEWNEIDKIKPAPMGVGMKLTNSEGKSITVSSQVDSYSTIVEILHKIRPDLFDMTGVKIFQKGFLGKYGLFFFLIPATPMALGAIFPPPFLPGILVAILVFFFWNAALHAVHLVKVEDEKLSTKSFRKNQEVTVQQIKEINMITVRNRKGVARNFIKIELRQGEHFHLSGFPEGNEIMYGFLKNWWGARQTI